LRCGGQPSVLLRSASELAFFRAASNLSASAAARFTAFSIGAHARILHPLRPFAFLIRHRAAGGRSGGQFLVGEIERHVRIVAPPGARVHAVQQQAGH
jgi:hypothetical protein